MRPTLLLSMLFLTATAAFASPSTHSPSSPASALSARSNAPRRTLPIQVVTTHENEKRAGGLEKRRKSGKSAKAAKRAKQRKAAKSSKANALKKLLKNPHGGDGTFFGVGLGACGHHNTDKDMIVAVSHTLYDSFPGATPNPNNNPICGRRIRANIGSKSVIVKVADRCVGCKPFDLDFSPAAFKKLANPRAGRVKIRWTFV